MLLRGVIALLIFAASSTSHSAETKEQGLVLDANLSLAAGERHSLTVELADGAYLKGHLQGTVPFTAFIADDDGVSLRQLVSPGTTEARVFFSAPQGGRYLLNIMAGDQALDVAVSLKNMPLQGRGERESTPMPSAVVQAAASRLDEGVHQERIWAQLTASGAPLVELPSDLPAGELASDERLVTFLWQGARERVQVLGAPGHEHDELYRLGESDIWYRSYRLPADTRMSYQLAPDVPRVEGSKREQRIAILATAQRDPANPDAWSPDGLSDNFNTKSLLELDQAVAALLPGADSPQIAAQHFRLQDEALGNTRSIDIWVPDELESVADKPAPLAIFFDGLAYQHRIPTPAILNKLIQEGRIPPTVAVFVDNPDRAARARELPCNVEFADFMAQRLLPFVREKTALQFTPEQTLLAGASYGGLAAACTAWRHPQHFGMVLSQSGSFWWSPAEEERPEWLAARFAESDRLPIRFYLSAGCFEEAFGESGILSANRRLDQMLRVKGYSVQLEEFSAGHDYHHWRATLGRGLEYLLGGREALPGR